MALIQHDWCPYKKGKHGHHYAQREDYMRRHREKTAIRKQKGETWSWLFVQSPQQGPIMLTLWFQTSSLQNCQTAYVFCLSHLVCSTLLWQLSKLIHSPSFCQMCKYLYIYMYTYTYPCMGFPDGLVVKSPSANAEDAGDLASNMQSWRVGHEWVTEHSSVHTCICECVNIHVYAGMHAKCFSHVQLCATPQTIACQAPLFMWFPRQEYRSGLPFPFPEDLPNPATEPASLMSSALAGRFFTTSTTWEALNVCIHIFNWYRNLHTALYLFFNLYIGTSHYILRYDHNDDDDNLTWNEHLLGSGHS